MSNFKKYNSIRNLLLNVEPHQMLVQDLASKANLTVQEVIQICRVSEDLSYSQGVVDFLQPYDKPYFNKKTKGFHTEHEVKEIVRKLYSSNKTAAEIATLFGSEWNSVPLAQIQEWINSFKMEPIIKMIDLTAQANAKATSNNNNNNLQDKEEEELFVFPQSSSRLFFKSSATLKSDEEFNEESYKHVKTAILFNGRLTFPFESIQLKLGCEFPPSFTEGSELEKASFHLRNSVMTTKTKGFWLFNAEPRIFGVREYQYDECIEVLASIGVKISVDELRSVIGCIMCLISYGVPLSFGSAIGKQIKDFGFFVLYEGGLGLNTSAKSVGNYNFPLYFLASFVYLIVTQNHPQIVRDGNSPIKFGRFSIANGMPKDTYFGMIEQIKFV